MPFPARRETIPRPKPKGYRKEQKTIGDQVRKWRIDRGLFQADIAELLEITEPTIYNWEHGTKPAIEHMPGIIELMGYLPVEIDISTLAGQVKLYQYRHGVSGPQLATMIGVDKSTIFHLEKGTYFRSGGR